MQANQEKNDQSAHDYTALMNALVNASLKIQPLMLEAISKFDFNRLQKETPIQFNSMRDAYEDYIKTFTDNPQKFAEMHMDFTRKWMELWQKSVTEFVSGTHEQAKDASQQSGIPHRKDRRFSSELWEKSAFFSFIKQYYLMTADIFEDAINDAEHIDEDTKKRVGFYLKQYIDAMAPTNFLFTNPDVIQETIDSKGENLVRGFENLINDMERGQGLLKISTTDYKAFEIGKNIAKTKGKVVFRNHLMELIQYEATTEKVHKKPVFISPPWINKYYILDLQEKNSFVKWLTDKGHTVFIISWVNPGKEHAACNFATYVHDGVLKALDVVQDITKEKSCNAIGYCVGGTALTMALSYLHTKGLEDQIASATFFTTLVDFSHAGDLKLFMDETHLDIIDSEMEIKGYLPAEIFRNTFSMLRANDMIWSFVVNNYLMGQTPFPFDILFWNDDTTNMPAALHHSYLKDLYLQNKLAIPNGFEIDDVPIDVTKIKTPTYCLATMDDHIVPWISAYKTTQLFSGPIEFTLSASGHVAGVINHPDKNKYCYWKSKKSETTAEEWYNGAKMHKGSWWPDFEKWLSKHSGGEQVPARKCGNKTHKPLDDAPGRYVRMKAPE